uniref:Uncharacterized protein n=1 Tax=uncultured marine virus TaxID=186617 RepID=A0A0F7L6C5_9VIRU|nr:hypothetical protein [uncultured marine virus]
MLPKRREREAVRLAKPAGRDHEHHRRGFRRGIQKQAMVVRLGSEAQRRLRLVELRGQGHHFLSFCSLLFRPIVACRRRRAGSKNKGRRWRRSPSRWRPTWRRPSSPLVTWRCRWQALHTASRRPAQLQPYQRFTMNSLALQIHSRTLFSASRTTRRAGSRARNLATRSRIAARSGRS